MAQCADAEVTTRWLGFHRIRHGTGEIFDSVDLFLPDVQFPTQVPPADLPDCPLPCTLSVLPEFAVSMAFDDTHHWRRCLHCNDTGLP